ncbi:MAG: lipid A deacylase LpxR family protein [Bacteroidota bacterium]
MGKLYQIIILLILIGNKALAQLPDSVSRPENYIKLNYDNDFFSATDRYYTQGIQFQVITRYIKYSPFSYALISLGKRAKNYYGINIEQDCFTPKSIRYDTINYLERPFAATVFVSHFLISLDAERKQLLQTQLDLGVIGPCARCEDEQKAIHKALVNIRPLGWEAQIAADYIINYRAGYEKAIIYSRYAELMGNVALRAGTLYNDGSLGIHFRAGLMNPYFNSLGIQKNGGRKFQIYVFFKANARAVGYNATMQGGLFNANSIFTVPSGDISRMVYDGTAGINLVIKRMQLEYSRSYITREFARGVDHGWGRVAIAVGF